MMLLCIRMRVDFAAGPGRCYEMDRHFTLETLARFLDLDRRCLERAEPVGWHRFSLLGEAR